MDPLSAMRMSAMGRIMPFNPPVVEAMPKIPTDGIQKLAELGPAQPRGLQPLGPGVQPGRAFSDFLSEMARDVNAKQASAGEAVNGVLAGENVPLHQAMLAVEEASVSFHLMVEVRNKLLESYQELMRMQI
jgi:flagellar hook-basal body complex protein FliE